LLVWASLPLRGTMTTTTVRKNNIEQAKQATKVLAGFLENPLPLGLGRMTWFRRRFRINRLNFGAMAPYANQSTRLDSANILASYKELQRGETRRTMFFHFLRQISTEEYKIKQAKMCGFT